MVEDAPHPAGGRTFRVRCVRRGHPTLERRAEEPSEAGELAERLILDALGLP